MTLIARIVSAKPRKRPFVRAIWEEMLSSEPRNAEVRAVTRAWVEAAFETAPKVEKRMKGKRRR